MCGAWGSGVEVGVRVGWAWARVRGTRGAVVHVVAGDARVRDAHG